MNISNARESLELFPISVSASLSGKAQATLLEGDTLETLKTLADGSVKLVVTSSPSHGPFPSHLSASCSFLRHIT